jgi:hypothetical protein
MRLLTARGFALAILAPALLIFTAIPGCSNESEGQRCGDDLGTNDDDCASGLVCISSALLLNSNGANRCCYAEASEVTDSRCTRTTNVAAGGSGGTAGSGTAGSGGTAGAASAGTGGTGTDTNAAGAADAATAGAGGG